MVSTAPLLPGGVIDRGREGASGFWAELQGSGGNLGARSSLDLPGSARPLSLLSAACTETTGLLHSLYPIDKFEWELVKMGALEKGIRI